MQKIRIKFTKGPEVKYISHLDLMRAFERAIRRTDIPIEYSHGYNPRMSISWGPPLPLGISSDCEMADLSINGWVRPLELRDKLNGALPAGFRVLEATLANPKAPSLDSHMNRAEYSAAFDPSDEQRMKNAVSGILERKELPFEKDGKIRDKRPMLHDLRIEGSALVMVLQVGGGGTLKVSEVRSLLGDVKLKDITRRRLFVA